MVPAHRTVTDSAATVLVMTRSRSGVIAAQRAIDDLAALLVRARTAFGRVSVNVNQHLETAEMDLLSARDAIEKACWEWMIAPSPLVMSADPRGRLELYRRPARSLMLPNRPPGGRTRRAPGRTESGTRSRRTVPPTSGQRLFRWTTPDLTSTAAATVLRDAALPNPQDPGTTEKTRNERLRPHPNASPGERPTGRAPPRVTPG